MQMSYSGTDTLCQMSFSGTDIWQQAACCYFLQTFVFSMKGFDIFLPANWFQYMLGVYLILNFFSKHLTVFPMVKDMFCSSVMHCLCILCNINILPPHIIRWIHYTWLGNFFYTLVCLSSFSIKYTEQRNNSVQTF